MVGIDDQDEESCLEEALKKADWVVHFAGPPCFDEDGFEYQRCIDCGFYLPVTDGTFWQPEEYVGITYVDSPFRGEVGITFGRTVGDRKLVEHELFCRELVTSEQGDNIPLY